MYKALFIQLGLLISCSDKSQVSKIEELPKQRPLMVIDSSLKKCIQRQDTIVNASTSINYVIIDTFYTVKLKIGGIDTLLNYQFDCNIPRGLVPYLHSYFGNIICLIRGSGQHYREFVIAYTEGGKIILKKFETALTTDLRSKTVIYQNYDKPEEIIAEDIKTGTRQTFNLPPKYVNSNILSTSIRKGKLELNFSNGKLVYDL